MEISVVVPTLNGRDRLAAGLDAIAAHAPTAEVIVANGPSADGTTGMVREREDIDILVEISDRTVNVARNAGFEVASGEVIAFVDFFNRIDTGWLASLRAGLERASVVTGPVHREVKGGHTTETQETGHIAGHDVNYFNGGNVAFHARVPEQLDGFDEYLVTGGARDAAHRLVKMGIDVAWEPGMCVTHEPGEDPNEWGWKYRALAYRAVKNYGLQPTVLRRLVSHATGDAIDVAKDVLSGNATPTAWFGNGRDIVLGLSAGVSDGIVARTRDRTPRRNPNGISARADRAVARYDWRSERAPSLASNN